METLAVTIDPALDLFEEIERLKRELNAVILAHFYQNSDIQDIADFVEDSLGLARRAEGTEAEVIVFCGVHFMAETAKILNPEKPVLLPDLAAGCSLSDSCPPEQFAKFKAAHPNHLVVSYINCSAGIKALSDIIVTSTNAEKIVRQIPEDQPIIFAPDKNLGGHINRVTGRQMLLWNGTCIVHEQFSERKLRQLKVRHPNAPILAHPECEEPVLRLADHIGSTSSILRASIEMDADEFIVVTEPGLIHQMERASPGKRFIMAPPDHGCACNECPHMRLNTLEKLYLCMRDRTPELMMDRELLARARRPIDRMLEMS
ncbi:quinolinate synthase NadA [Candidatus Sumerlaeota bacterium]|nr:quinolinate synthase NadA [Candidatus Sumerlaeota bacterium]